MTLLDLLKALGIAVAILIVNVLISIVVVLFYSIVIDPGHPHEYYNEAAMRIAPWCSHIAGTALFFGAGYLFARRRPERNGYLFAAAFTVLYAIIDAATVVLYAIIDPATGGIASIFNLQFGLSMLAKLLAAVGGTWLGSRNRKRPA